MSALENYSFFIDTCKILPYKKRKGASAINTAPLLTTNKSDLVTAEPENNTIILSYKYKLRPTAKQHGELDALCESQRILYNAALQERIACYEKTGKGRSYMAQCKAVTELRQEPEYSNIPANLQRATLKRIDEAFQGFFRRLKTKEKAGFPRFKGKYRWNSFGFAEFSGITLKDNRLRFKGLSGSLRVHIHRELPEGKPLSCTFQKDHKGWSISLQYRIAKAILPKTGKRVGIDVGLTHLAALSTGEMIPNIKPSKQAARKLRIANRALARCKKGSNRRAKVKLKLVRCHAKIKSTRATYLHQVSARLVKEFDYIAMEDLSVKGLTGGMLAGSVNDAAWGMLRQFTTYKAENADKTFEAKDPRRTSQECPGCGAIVKKTLSQRVHKCACGSVMPRDTASAIVILNRAVPSPRQHNVADYRKRVAGNITLPARAI